MIHIRNKNAGWTQWGGPGSQAWGRGWWEMPRAGWWASDTKAVPGRVKWTGKTHPRATECIMGLKGSPGVGSQEAWVLVDSATDPLAI